jgi:hypothetical protein
MKVFMRLVGGALAPGGGDGVELIGRNSSSRARRCRMARWRGGRLDQDVGRQAGVLIAAIHRSAAVADRDADAADAFDGRR